VIAKTHNYVNLAYYRAVDRLVATTADQRAWLLAQGVAAARVQVIPNFSALAPAPPRGAWPEVVRLLGFGRFVRKKGFDVLLTALAGTDLGRPWHLTLGGEGPLGPELRALAHAARLRGRVSFPGWLSDVRAALTAHDLFLLPSRAEPFGIALVEAMAAGTPIIATRTEGPREILDESVAFLVAPEDPAALAQAIIGALADPQAARAKAQAAQSRFLARYSVEVVVPQYESLYARVVAGLK
jgi:glycosyltransferase involved in cell wall biosynthesis